ncbi:MAG: hypothetical protein FD180_3083 [Planctomycetota bacterium]|nr:MAG: hypothetical protein FD180_3083 [Planctomycetota bacterium]
MKRRVPVRVFGKASARLRSILAAAARAAGPLKGPVDIHLVSDAAIRKVNRERLGHDYATDVCTFPMEEPFLWGELVVSAQTARREARQRKLPVENELSLYVIHGVLHLRGLDDRSSAGRSEMKKAEARSLANLFRT